MKGILLIALGKHYSRLAFNMASSIKDFTDIPISCITDETDRTLLTVYDKIIKPNICDYHEGYAFNPFQLKTKIYNYTPYDHTIYLDVDGLALKDITPLFGYDFKIQEVGKYTYKTSDKCHMVWVNKAGKKLTDVYDSYELDKDSEYPEYNSSIIVFKKSKKNEKYFNKVEDNYNDRRLDFKPIGGLYPDELAWNLASVQLNHYSETPNEKPIYFQWENKMMDVRDINKNYYLLGMAGGYHKGKLRYYYESKAKKYSSYWQFDSKKKIFHKK